MTNLFYYLAHIVAIPFYLLLYVMYVDYLLKYGYMSLILVGIVLLIIRFIRMETNCCQIADEEKQKLNTSCNTEEHF